MSEALQVRVQQRSCAILSLRGNSDTPAFADGVKAASGVALPVQVNTFATNLDNRIQWVGPDDWFVIANDGSQAELARALRSALSGLHFAVTDVSGGYQQFHVSGSGARQLLAAGCPLDLHERIFSQGQCAGSVFFKAQIYIACLGEAPEFSILVRTSFTQYFWELVQASTKEMTLIRD